MPENVIFLQRPTPSLDRQMAVCLPYLDEHDYQPIHIVHSHVDACRLVMAGEAKVVVAAYPDRKDWRLAALLDHAKGRLEICRELPERASPLGHDTEEIIRRMADRGGTTSEIVRLWGAAEERVRRVLRRHRNG